MKFLEPLPKDNCPPGNATTVGFPKIFRLVARNTISEDTFKSHAALGIVPRGKADMCRWSSCSLVLDPVAHIKRWPRLRDQNPYACELAIPPSSGMAATKGDPNHYDFWCSSQFNMAQAVVNIVALPQVVTNA